jgi:hypothetical protein
MYEVPQMQTHPLDKFRTINCQNLNATNVSGSNCVGFTVTSTVAYLTGSTLVSGGSVYAGSLLYGLVVSGSNWNHGSFTLTASTGSLAHGLATTPCFVSLIFTGATNASGASAYNGTYGWYPTGSSLIIIWQTGSGTVGGTWFAMSQ